MVIKKQAILLFLLTLIYSINVTAIGITPDSATLNFEPNTKNTLTFYAINNRDDPVYIVPSVYGDLEKYMKIQDNSPKLVNPGDALEIKVDINFPSTINVPGVLRSYVGASENLGEVQEGLIYAIGGVSAIIDVKVPYPGKYAKIDLIVPNTDVGQTANFKGRVENLGEQSISQALITLSVQDKDKILAQKITESFYLESKEVIDIPINLDTKNIPGGDYKAIAILDYDTLKAGDEEDFRLGDLFVNLTNYTKEFEINKINRWNMWVESRWNKPIEAVHGEAYIIKDGQEIDIHAKTATVYLNPWESTRIVAYWDTTGFKPGEYDAKIKLIHNKKVDESSFKIKIIKPEFLLNLQFPLIYEKAGFMILLLILVIIIIIFDIIFLIKTSKKNKK